MKFGKLEKDMLHVSKAQLYTTVLYMNDMGVSNETMSASTFHGGTRSLRAAAFDGVYRSCLE